MFKKPIFLFITVFVLILVLGGYFISHEVRGVGGIVNITELNMGDNKIINLLTPASDSDAVNMGYLSNLPILYIGGRSIDSWCDVQYFTWCTAGDTYDPPEPLDPCGDDFCDYPEEDGGTCPEDCECNDDGTCDPWEDAPSCPGDCLY